MASSSSCSSFKRQKLSHDHATTTRPQRKQHLYLVPDDWKGGYSLHKIDADEIMDDDDDEAAGLHKLPEPAALRLASPVASCRMAFAALGTNIFIAVNPRHGWQRNTPRPTFVYDADTGALSGGPQLPDRLYSFAAAMTVGESLYVLTSVYLDPDESPTFQALSWAPSAANSSERDMWDPPMEWSWRHVPPPGFDGREIVAHAVHPDGRTLFVSTERFGTHCFFDTGNGGAWTKLGDWVLPFRGQAYFDAELDVWVGLHDGEDGYVCCCPVASRSAGAATQPPECRMLKEKLFPKEDYPPQNGIS